MTEPAPVLSILIVNWNARDLLRRCLDSLAGTRVPSEIILVDNASTDGTLAMLAVEFPRETTPALNVIASPRNLGFAAANNLAASHARGEWLLLLNPDTEVPAGTLETMIEFVSTKPEIGAAGPELRNPDGSHQRSCWRGYPGLWMAISDAFYLWKLPWLPGSEYAPSELRAARPVDHLLGACLFIRRAAWNQVGALDEDYFLFLEETDWCWRAERAGWQIYYVPEVHITHYGQHSMRQAPLRNIPHFYASYLRFYRSHHPRARVRLRLLKMVTATACLVRIALWQLRRSLARESVGRARAGAMAAGYRQALAEVATA